MGYVEVWNANGDNKGWTALANVEMIDTINCQLCNEPTLAHDIVAMIVVKDELITVGSWQCRKCHAVNG